MDFERIKGFAFTNIGIRGWVEIIVVCLMSAIIWVKSVPHESPIGEYHVAASAPEIRYVDRQVIVPKQVIVYRDRAKTDLELPAPVVNNPDIHVLEAAKLVASDHPQTAVCVQDQQTGQAQIIARIDPMPWLAAENRGEVGLSYGFSNAGLKARLNAREDFVQIKDIHFGLNGTLDSDGNTFAGVGAFFRW